MTPARLLSFLVAQPWRAAVGLCLGLFVALSCAPVHKDAQLQAGAAPVTLAVVNARLWTGEPQTPWASAVAVAGARIVAVGDDQAVRAMAGSAARVIDAGGQLLLPGFIDAHIHFLDGGMHLSSVQLRDAKTRAEFVARIAAYARRAPPGAWITGGDWDHQQWGGELPRRDWIDAVTADHPVWLGRLDGHMALANSRALALAGITADTKDPPGGALVRDKSGAPTGILKDNAMALLDRILPAPSPQQSAQALEAAMDYVARQGVTSVHHMGTWPELEAFTRAHAQGRLRTRIYVAVPLKSWERLRDYGVAHGRGDDWLRIGGLKGFVDGSLGSHTAAMLSPFSDTPGDTGLLVNTPAALYTWISGADRAGLQVMVHAIGDRAIRLLLDTYARVARENGIRDRRFRIEHAQHIAASDVPRFAQLGVIASMQPYHAIDDGCWAEKVIGAERAQTSYALRALQDSGARLAFGSDWYVAPPVPLMGIYAAVTRRTLDGKHPDGWVPAQKIGVADAVRAYTMGGAYAEGAEDRKGSLRPGKLADFILIDRDLFTIRPSEIANAQVTLTVVGGRIVYERTAAAAPTP